MGEIDSLDVSFPGVSFGHPFIVPQLLLIVEANDLHFDTTLLVVDLLRLLAYKVFQSLPDTPRLEISAWPEDTIANVMATIVRTIPAAPKQAFYGALLGVDSNTGVQTPLST